MAEKVSSDRGYRIDTIAISRDMGPLSTLETDHARNGPRYAGVPQLHSRASLYTAPLSASDLGQRLAWLPLQSLPVKMPL